MNGAINGGGSATSAYSDNFHSYHSNVSKRPKELDSIKTEISVESDSTRDQSPDGDTKAEELSPLYLVPIAPSPTPSPTPSLSTTSVGEISVVSMSTLELANFLKSHEKAVLNTTYQDPKKTLEDIPPSIVSKAIKSIKKLGQGVNGVTEVAEIAGKKYASKSFHISTRPTEKNRERESKLKRECSIGHFLAHPNIATVAFTSEKNDLEKVVTLFSRLGEAGSLNTMIKKKTPFLHPIQIIQIGRALQFMHDHGIMHRDIKPANIVLMKNGDTLLIDFDSSRLFSDPDLDTMEGTSIYMAPEMIQSLDVTKKADIASFGFTLLHLYYKDIAQNIVRISQGKSVLKGAREFTCMSYTLSEFYNDLEKFLKKHKPELNPLEMLMWKMISKDPDQRPELDWIADVFDEAPEVPRTKLNLF